MTAPRQYPTGAVKQDPVSLHVAVRTVFPEGDTAWACCSCKHGTYYASSDDVASWVDIA